MLDIILICWLRCALDAFVHVVPVAGCLCPLYFCGKLQMKKGANGSESAVAIKKKREICCHGWAQLSVVDLDRNNHVETMCTQTFCEMSKVFLLLSECNCHRIHDRTNKRAVIYYIRCSNFQLFHRIRSLGFLSAALSSHPFLLNLSFLLLFKFIFCTQELCSARSSFFSKWNEIAFISLHVCWPELFCVTYRLNQLCFQSIFPVFSDRSLCPAIAEVVLILWEASYSDLYSLCPSNWLHQKWIANLHSFFSSFQYCRYRWPNVINIWSILLEWFSNFRHQRKVKNGKYSRFPATYSCNYRNH